jgi:hypothetical protein
MIATGHTSPEQIIVILVFFVVFGAIAAFATANKGSADPRSLELQALASRLAFDSFNPDSDEEFAQGWGFLNLLDQGTHRYAFNLLKGKYHDDALFVFDYHYQTGEGKNQSNYYLTVLMLVMGEAFPSLSIGSEHFQDRIAQAVGLENDIKFESAEFSKKFRATSSDKKFAYDVCNPQMIEFLLANPDLQVEIQGPAIMLAFAPQLPVGSIEFNLQRLAQFRSLMPNYLFTDA